MADEKDELQIEAQLELEPEPKERRGFESLRGVKRSTYVRRSILRLLCKAPEEIVAHDCKNGFEMIAKNLILAKGRDGAIAVQVFREVKEALGERIGSRWKETLERNQGQPDIIPDLPTPDRAKAN